MSVLSSLMKWLFTMVVYIAICCTAVAPTISEAIEEDINNIQCNNSSCFSENEKLMLEIDICHRKICLPMDRDAIIYYDLEIDLLM